MYNYSETGQIDELITQGINLTGVSSPQLTFNVAYREYSTSYHDTLKVLVYTNCGTTYSSTIYSKTGSVLATGAATTSSFTPSVSSDWRQETLDLSAFAGSNITIRFQCVNGYGNNLYIDDINITGSVGLAANFSANSTSICPGGSVNFTDMSTGSPTSWSWNFGDGGTSGLQNPSHIYQIPGVYTVSLTASKTGSSNTITKTNYITVNQINAVSVSITVTPTGSVCQGSILTFTATGINGGGSPVYQWKKSGVNVGTNSTSYAPNDLVNGDVITCMLTSNISCTSGSPATSNSITAQVNSLLPVSVSISANPSGAICQGTMVTYTATGINGGSSPVYQWKKNNVNVGTNSTTFQTTGLNNSDIITCILTSNATCPSGSPATSNAITAVVNPLLPVSISITANPSGAICQGTNVVFTATGINAGSNPVYQWIKNGVSTGTNSTTFSANDLNNGDVITCILYSNAICATGTPDTSNSLTFQVNPVLPVSVSITANPSGILCAGGQVTFTAVGINGGLNPVYQWKKNGINTGTNSFTYQASGMNTGDIVTCVLTSNATCASGSPALSNAITLQVNPVLSTTMSSTNETNGQGNGTATVNVTGGTSPYTYLWSNGGLTSTITGLSAGTYSVTITDANLCTSVNSTVVNNQGNSPGQPIFSTYSKIVCRNQTGVNYAVSAVPYATGYTWTLPAGATITSGQGTTSIQVNFSSTANSGTMSVYAYNTFGNGPSATYAYTVALTKPATPAAIIGSLMVCAGSTASFSIAPVTNATSYTWVAPTNCTITSGQGTTSITVSVTSTWTTGLLKVSASNCAGTSTQKSVTIYSKPGTPGTITGLVNGVCANTSGVVYSIPAVNYATNYTWVVPTGATIASGQGTTSISVNFGSTFTSGNVSVTASNACGSGSTKTVTVRSVPNKPGTITGQTYNLCSATNITYTIAAVTGATSYVWTVPTGATIVSGQGTISITVNFGSTFVSGSITVKSSNNCGISAATTLSVNSKPAAPGTITGPTSVCAYQQNVSYSVNPVVGATSYSWTLPTGCTISSGAGTNAIQVNFGATAGKIYAFALNACGKGTGSYKTITIGCKSEIISQQSFEDLLVYPNPTSGLFNLSFYCAEIEDITFNVKNLIGENVMLRKYTTSIGDNQVEVQGNDLADGIYLLIIQSPNQRPLSRRLVISR
ncbi:MAG: PKD domain-containing protein [Bacteroidetes bacterium]|nr:PKD domain-containing protein [Bacteroidota bacterium]